MLDLTPDELLATTRSVRRRLDFERPVARELIEECLDLAQQAPTGGNSQNWAFLVVMDAAKRARIGELYRQGWTAYRQAIAERTPSSERPDRGTIAVYRSAQYLADRMGDVPVMVIPCIERRTDHASIEEQAATWGSILPATWSFMLAARARGLGTCWTTLHLPHEREAAEVLGIPYDTVMQAALIPVAHTIGDEFRPGPRKPLDAIVHWDRW
ncbi:MAG: nitroreductase family protein [Thermomicrobiales bacterium]